MKKRRLPPLPVRAVNALSQLLSVPLQGRRDSEWRCCREIRASGAIARKASNAPRKSERRVASAPREVVPELQPADELKRRPERVVSVPRSNNRANHGLLPAALFETARRLFHGQRLLPH